MPGRAIVLGSGSPRRKEILAWMGVPFRVVVPNIDETEQAGESANAYLERIVRAKWMGVATLAPAEAILVADTIVVLNGRILGKPRDRADAAQMIQSLGAAAHEVSTRFAFGSSAGSLIEKTVRTTVTFRAVSATEAQRYAETDEGLDKAGGYAIQGRAGIFIQEIRGSYTNVVGLPACEVKDALESHPG